MLTRRDVIVGLAATSVTGLVADPAYASPDGDRTLEDFVGPDVLKIMDDELPVLDGSGRLRLTPHARADLTRFATAKSIRMHVRLPTKTDSDIAFLLMMRSEKARGTRAQMFSPDEPVRLMWKDA